MLLSTFNGIHANAFASLTLLIEVDWCDSILGSATSPLGSGPGAFSLFTSENRRYGTFRPEQRQIHSCPSSTEGVGLFMFEVDAVTSEVGVK